MLYLSGGVHSALYGQPYIGWMLTPYIGNKAPVRHNWWASDTGCFAGDFNESKYFGWLERMHSQRFTCLFATAPDVIPMRLEKQGINPNEAGKRTLERAAPYLPRIREVGFRAALVAQNGMEHLELPWDTFDVLFIGGDNAFKLGQEAVALVAQAKLRNKWVHMGRVNSLKRIKYASQIGCDSTDGTFIKYGPAINIPKLLTWLSEVNRLELAG